MCVCVVNVKNDEVDLFTVSKHGETPIFHISQKTAKKKEQHTENMHLE